METKNNHASSTQTELEFLELNYRKPVPMPHSYDGFPARYPPLEYEELARKHEHKTSRIIEVSPIPQYFYNPDGTRVLGYPKKTTDVES